MVECEMPRLDQAASAPVDDTTPAHSRLLDSVAAFTHHRDVDALDHSLVLSLAELSSAHSVSLGRRIVDGRGDLYSMVYCAPDAQGQYQLRVVESGAGNPALASMRRCMDRQQAQEEVTEGGIHRLVVPILGDGRAIGALQLDGGMSSSASRPLAEGFARIYANYTALLHESERDKLTGLYNRRTFERHLQRMLLCNETSMVWAPSAERRRMQAPTQVWLAILDIDHFKRINDSYGHIYGDEVILLLAQQMRGCFRHGDVLFRFGGEEFVILLNANDEAAVHAMLERFRLRMATHVFPQVEHVTVSIGYAQVGEHDYPATVLDRADKALYYAKEHGRNCTYGYGRLASEGLLGESVVAGSIDLF